ncbi:AAA family ATPase [Methylophaga thalassica]|uniref:AAA family ATPase n=1 Tax=Methylophaga aminisulfidivorans TaxID=230105 RepID=UPI003A904B3B
MEDPHITALKAAYKQSPENDLLRILLIEELYKLDHNEEAAELILESNIREPLTDKQRILFARVMLNIGAFDESLSYCHDNDPELCFIQAKAYFELQDVDSAKRYYQKAITDNATLEDPTFNKLLNSNVYQFNDRHLALRVVSNDDTNKSELKRLLMPEENKVTFKDVGGLDAVKKQIQKKIIIPFQKPSLFERFKKKIGGGILLYGPPGCGKTLLARATAGECNARFFNVVISDVLDMYIGESESKLHAIFEEARANKPAVIFFDEVEALAAKRQNTRDGTSSQLVSQFLSELDGFAQNNKGVLILGATNVPWALDPAFRRPGRFDRVVFIAPPDYQARVDILNGLLQERPGGNTIDVQKIAKATSGFSGADIQNLVDTAVDEAIDESISSGYEVPLNNENFANAIKEVHSTVNEWLSTARNYARYANDAGQYNDVLDFINKHGK